MKETLYDRVLRLAKNRGMTIAEVEREAKLGNGFGFVDGEEYEFEIDEVEGDVIPMIIMTGGKVELCNDKARCKETVLRKRRCSRD